MKMGWSIHRIAALTHIDPWFLDQIQQLVEFEDELFFYECLDDLPRDVLFKAKQLGYSDPQLAYLYLGDISTETILQVRDHRKRLKVEPVYKLVDTCAAEFEALTPYFYSTYETAFATIDTACQSRGVPAPGRAQPGDVQCQTAGLRPDRAGDSPALCEDEIRVTERRKIIILGGGPNRIGQGIEFDYCCCQASFACREMGFESVMINSNPETVSTDYDTSDFLFFEPLTLEDTLNVVERLNGGGIDVPARSGKVAGCIVQFGGQTPLNLAHGLVAAGVPLIGTALDSIDLAEDRDRFKVMLEELGMTQPNNGIAYSLHEAISVATRIGYPVLVRPSYVLGGRGMETCFDEAALRRYMRTAVDVSDLADAPVLIDRFLSEAIEVDVDVVGDFGDGIEASRDQGIEGSEADARALICGVMEHIEEAGIHSGDSACTIPPYSLRPVVVDRSKTMRVVWRRASTSAA